MNGEPYITREDKPVAGALPRQDELSSAPEDGVVRITPCEAVGAYLDGVWRDAMSFKQTSSVEESLLECRRQYEGVYSPQEEAELRMSGKPLVYVPLSGQKASTAQAWLTEFFDDAEKVFTVEPTPDPEMPKRAAKEAEEFSLREFESLYDETGGEVSPALAKTFALRLRSIIERRMQDEAQARAERMSRVLRDDLVHGAWGVAVREVVNTLAIYGTAFMRAPVLRRETRLAWRGDSVREEERLARCFEAISPFDVFPSQGMKDVSDGDLCIRVRYRSESLAAMRGLPGWFPQEIDEVLRRYAYSGIRLHTAADDELRRLDALQSSSVDVKGLVEGFEFWGSLSGEMLNLVGISAGPKMERIENSPLVFYTVNAVVVASRLVYCRIMSAGEQRPVDAVHFYENPSSFWGKGPLHRLRHLQKICNASARSLVLNMGYASAPQMTVDYASLDPRDNGKPGIGKVWALRHTQTYGASQAKPVNFFTVPSIANDLLAVFETFQRKADEVTGIPAFANGTDAATGAARTARGLKQLMDTANRGIKYAAGNIDAMSARVLERLFWWHMMYNPDSSIKGDTHVRVQGLRNFVSKTSQSAELLNLLIAIYQNPALAKFQTDRKTATVLREIARGYDMPAEALSPDATELDLMEEVSRQQSKMEAQAAAQQALPPAGASRQPTPAPAGGSIPAIPPSADRGDVTATGLPVANGTEVAA